MQATTTVLGFPPELDDTTAEAPHILVVAQTNQAGAEMEAPSQQASFRSPVRGYAGF